ncbi:RES family NAD+ phosphorylase [Marinobacter shengliensis]|uniref:RES family NAD+ phosphorylase n=1 Tax=Marinobacter shengliensis TaxID=1389223 RepID=UPI001109CC32|nr:RES family NAD+ phosphorylase [Marinobacter shengliensis]
MGVSLPTKTLKHAKAYRLINSKLPTIELFDDVADAADFQDLYDLQALTNPRLSAQVGNIEYLNVDEAPWGIPGCSYAVAAFTHVSPDGSRFSNGEFGMLYVADEMETAIQEVAYHQGRYLANVEDLSFDRMIFRGLACTFSGTEIHDATTLPLTDGIYASGDYTDARALGSKLRKAGSEGLEYWSVRSPGNKCWGLFTPKGVESIVQTAHYEFVIDGRNIVDICEITTKSRLQSLAKGSGSTPDE